VADRRPRPVVRVRILTAAAEYARADRLSIDPASFAYVSYIDVLGGRIERARSAANRSRGLTANELRDVLLVAAYRALPGVVVQAFATARRSGLLRAGLGLSAALLAAWAAFCAAFLAPRLALRPRFTAGAPRLCAATLLLYAFATRCSSSCRSRRSRDVLRRHGPLARSRHGALAYALRLRRRDALLTSVVESSSDCIVCIQHDGVIRNANDATSRLLGCPSAALHGWTSEHIPAFGDDGSASRRLRLDPRAHGAHGRRPQAPDRSR
jgi:PAS domain-containing protein